MDTKTLIHRLGNQIPFILIDKILEIEEDKRLIALKNISLNEPIFSQSNLEDPTFPHSLIIESIIQATEILLSKQNKFSSIKIFLETIESIQFKGNAYPADQLRLEIELENKNDHHVKIRGKALIDGKLICEGKFFFTLTEMPSKGQIHPTASIHPSAILGKDIMIGPYAIIGENTIIGDRTRIEAHSFIDKWCQIGNDCEIHFGCVIGSPAQDIKYKGEKSGVIIGNNTILREYVTINRATGENHFTKIGDNCLLLTNVHIGHNCEVANQVVITNLTHISGHVLIEEKAIIGGMVGVHQFTRIGKGCMVGGYSRIAQDVPPFMLCEGNPAYIRTPNLIGLKRSGASLKTVKEIKQAYKIIFRSQLNTQQALEEIKKQNLQSEEVQYLINFISADSKRGITKKALDSDEETTEFS